VVLVVAATAAERFQCVKDLRILYDYASVLRFCIIPLSGINSSTLLSLGAPLHRLIHLNWADFLLALGITDMRPYHSTLQCRRRLLDALFLTKVFKNENSFIHRLRCYCTGTYVVHERLSPLDGRHRSRLFPRSEANAARRHWYL
jgi:hypothetical protein